MNNLYNGWLLVNHYLVKCVNMQVAVLNLTKSKPIKCSNHFMFRFWSFLNRIFGPERDPSLPEIDGTSDPKAVVSTFVPWDLLAGNNFKKPGFHIQDFLTRASLPGYHIQGFLTGLYYQGIISKVSKPGFLNQGFITMGFVHALNSITWKAIHCYRNSKTPFKILAPIKKLLALAIIMWIWIRIPGLKIITSSDFFVILLVIS